MAEMKMSFPPSFFEEEDKVLRVSSDTKRVWAVELDLLAELQRVCSKHNIKFFAISGTLIGAARHKGFIPWDDDIDVVMMRSEYEKLLSIAVDEFKEPYFLQTPFSDPESGYGFAKLMNCSTTAVYGSNVCNGVVTLPARHGILLDIFPLDRIPDDEKDRRLFSAALAKHKATVVAVKRWRMLARHWKKFPKTPGNMFRAFLGKLESLRRRISGRDMLIESSRRLDQMAQRYNTSPFEKCAPVTNTPFPRKHEVFFVSSFDKCVELPFEMTRIPCPQNYKTVLDNAFGDWHKHVVGGSAHTYAILDVDKSYRCYMGKYKNS